jgi:hypothetical protein
MTDAVMRGLIRNTTLSFRRRVGMYVVLVCTSYWYVRRVGMYVGKPLREVDSVLPGKHVILPYDTSIRTEAQTLAQPRTGHSKLRGFLARIRAEAHGTKVT